MEWVLYLIPIAAVLSWGAIGVTKAVGRNRAADPDAVAQVRTRVDAIDARLAAVEKTLNDIP